MTDEFDPYQEWLEIAPHEQPPNHYRLLGLELYEDDPATIEAAVDQRMEHVRTFQLGQHMQESQEILSQLAAAKVCLCAAERKASYDEELRLQGSEGLGDGEPDIGDESDIDHDGNDHGFGNLDFNSLGVGGTAVGDASDGDAADAVDVGGFGFSSSQGDAGQARHEKPAATKGGLARNRIVIQIVMVVGGGVTALVIAIVFGILKNGDGSGTLTDPLTMPMSGNPLSPSAIEERDNRSPTFGRDLAGTGDGATVDEASGGDKDEVDPFADPGEEDDPFADPSDEDDPFADASEEENPARVEVDGGDLDAEKNPFEQGKDPFVEEESPIKQDENPFVEENPFEQVKEQEPKKQKGPAAPEKKEPPDTKESPAADESESEEENPFGDAADSSSDEEAAKEDEPAREGDGEGAAKEDEPNKGDGDAEEENPFEEDDPFSE